MALMQWHIVSRDVFNAGTPQDNHLYFITGENVIYRGSELFTKGMEFYTTTLPTNPAPYRLYVDTVTFEGKMWDGSAWHQAIKPLAETIQSTGVNPVSGKAVYDFVTTEIAKITGSETGVVLTGASWDGDNHILTFAKGAAEPINITLTGLGVGLSFDNEANTLNLIDASGNVLGEGVSMDLERFVKSGEYVDADKKIVLYFNDEKTDFVEIPVGDLVDTYTAESSATLTLEVAANVIKGAVKVSAEAGNALVAKEDGLYVAPVDVSGKMDKDTDAVPGDIAVFDKNGNAVDSGKTFEDIVPNNHVYTGATLDAAITGATPVKGDVAVVITPIGETGKSQRTGYHFDGESWIPMDEYYNAENVYFPADLTTTSAIGNITLTNGQATIKAAGKSIQEVWNAIFIKEKNPSTSQPSVSLTANQNKAYEVGTTVTPSYTATLKAGSYTYGPATGITATSWTVTNSDGASKDTNSGSFDSIEVGDDTNYTITATATYDDGTIPVTNTGNEYAAGQIKAGSKSATSAAITGFRRGFYGTMTSKPAVMTSDMIRALASSTDAKPATGDLWEVAIPLNAMRVVFAYPADVADASSVEDVNGMYAQVLSSFTKTEVLVEGANGYQAVAYKVYYADFADPNDKVNTYNVTL